MIDQKTRLNAADAALKMLNSGESLLNANREFARMAGIGLRYRNKADFISMLNFYAEVK